MKFQYNFTVSAVEMIFKFPNGYPVFADTIDNAMEGYLDWGLGQDLEEVLIPVDGTVDPRFYDYIRETCWDTDILEYFKYDLNSIEVVDAKLEDNDCYITYKIDVEIDLDEFAF